MDVLVETRDEQTPYMFAQQTTFVETSAKKGKYNKTDKQLRTLPS